MNMQAMMQQAQKLQKEMQQTKQEIEKQTFVGNSALVKAEINGKKEIKKITIKNEFSIAEEDLEIIEDMVLIAINDALKLVNEETNKKMGKINPSLSELF